MIISRLRKDEMEPTYKLSKTDGPAVSRYCNNSVRAGAIVGQLAVPVQYLQVAGAVRCSAGHVSYAHQIRITNDESQLTQEVDSRNEDVRRRGRRIRLTHQTFLSRHIFLQTPRLRHAAERQS